MTENVVSPADEAAIIALCQEEKVKEASKRLQALFQAAYPEYSPDQVLVLAAAWIFARRFRALLIREGYDA